MGKKKKWNKFKFKHVKQIFTELLQNSNLSTNQSRNFVMNLLHEKFSTIKITNINASMSIYHLAII